MTEEVKTTEPDLSLLGVTEAHARRARKWLADRSILSYYCRAEHSLRAPVTKHGRDWTYEAMRKAYEATR
jgi:hypothetical protein